VTKIKIPNGRWSKPVSGDRMYAVGRAYRERAIRMQSRPTTIVESPRAKLERELKERNSGTL
jgi:hypothetical protein